MPDDKNNTTSTPATTAPTPTPTDDSTKSSSAAKESDSVVVPLKEDKAKADSDDLGISKMLPEVINKIDEAHNILVALSGDPSVDEMAAAIGLSLFLDRLGKRATAIYSGSTPNALEFLKPEETFEPSVDALQDFVIALSKEKADHLRYKLDGDFVKIYITPYRTRISEEDLDFSYGDFNVDLVLALDVANGVDLDSALREHGRIMHDAVIVNITTGNPGKLGEIEWSDKTASSVSEMVARLLYTMNSKTKIEKEEATAFLTGIVAATNRFSNAKTTPESMRLASRLMESGANQQLISKNITPDIDNELFSLASEADPTKNTTVVDPTNLNVGHGNEENTNDEAKEADSTSAEKDSALLDDLKAAEASLSQAGAEATPELSNRPIKIDSSQSDPSNLDIPKGEDSQEENEEKASSPEDTTETVTETAAEATTESAAETKPESKPETESETEPKAEEESPSEAETTDLEKPAETEPSPESSTPNDNPSADFISDKPEKVVQPVGDLAANTLDEEGIKKYGQMLEDALADINIPNNTPEETTTDSFGANNPAVANAPSVPTNPEINGVPEINYMPMPGEEVLPPPPAPPIDMNAVPNPGVPGVVPGANEVVPDSLPNVAPITPASPAVEPTPTSLGPQPAMRDQVYAPQVADPGAFKIPGM